LAIWKWWLHVKYERAPQDLIITLNYACDSVIARLSGAATARHIRKIISPFKAAIASKKNILIDFSNTHAIDERFLGFLLMLRKKVKGSGANLILIGLSPGLKKIFRFNGLEYLLSSGKTGDTGPIDWSVTNQRD